MLTRCRYLVDRCDVHRTHSMAWILYHRALPKCEGTKAARAPGAPATRQPSTRRCREYLRGRCATSALPWNDNGATRWVYVDDVVEGLPRVVLAPACPDSQEVCSC